MRLPPLRVLLAILLLAILACGVIQPADAAELPPPLVAKFTRHVQPLLLNKCAAGACHGGPAAAVPRLQRGFGGGSLDRTTTLANLESFLAAVGTDRDPQQLVAALAVRHPATAAKGAIVAAPLSARERLTLEQWLADVRSVEPLRRFDPAVTPVTATVAEPSAAKPNRFRELLDTAANPPQLPPPQEPQGLIFKPDSGE
jgi:hypothetical protein